MGANRVNAAQTFEAIAEDYQADHRITRAMTFGAPALKVKGKVFACFYKGRLVLKLPKTRVDALSQSGKGQHFDPGMGRQMKEWASLDPSGTRTWRKLTAEALEFVAAGAKS